MDLGKFFNNLTNEEKAFELLSKEARRMAIEIANTRNTGVKDYPDGGYFSSKNKEIFKPEKIVVTQVEKRPEKTVITKTEMFFRNEDFEKQQKQIERKRKKLRKEMEKHFELSAIADYYEQDILDSYTESKVCDEW